MCRLLRLIFSLLPIIGINFLINFLINFFIIVINLFLIQLFAIIGCLLLAVIGDYWVPIIVNNED